MHCYICYTFTFILFADAFIRRAAQLIEFLIAIMIMDATIMGVNFI